ncbi:hypothetical protein DL93DRAFT_2078920 [Clavulina sp. PMI_390]|nr:hypothetical protein DL93DRAFT_2078920 [Clavulina sp. PMI_390]
MSFAITYHFASTDFRDNVLTDANGQILYWIETERGGLFNGPRTTHISKPSGSMFGKREPVASVDFRRGPGDPGKVVFRGQSNTLQDFFPRKGWWSKKRSMSTPSGTFYWSRDTAGISLLDGSNNMIVTYMSNHHVFSKSSPPALTLAESALSLDMDLIILGWVIMSRDAEAARRGAAAAAVGAAA